MEPLISDEVLVIRKFDRMIEICIEYQTAFQNGQNTQRLTLDNYN
jgi:hypothetical protein